MDPCAHARRVRDNPWSEHVMPPPHGTGVTPGSECGECPWCRKHRSSEYNEQRRAHYRADMEAIGVNWREWQR